MTTAARPGQFTGATDNEANGGLFTDTKIDGIPDLVAADVLSAQNSATTATTQATTATTQATTATTKATEASTSATAAATSATAAATSATAAAASATTASNATTSVSTNATNAAASETAAATSETNAAASASTAATQATNATTQANTALSSSSAASTSASNASTSATAAGNSATAAASSATSAANTLDSFDDRYLGAKNSNPSVDNDGDALVAGALYFNTSSGMKAYNGSAWEDLKPTTSEQTNINSLAGILDGTKTYAVTVTNPGSGNVFVLDGVNAPALTLVKGFTYTFDVSNGTVATHPLAFKDSGGNAYTTGVTVSGTAGNAGATVVIAVPKTGTMPARYYCTAHGNGMGNTITVEENDIATVASISSNVTAVATDATDIGLVAGSIANVNTTATNIAGVNSFAERYRTGSSDPGSSLDEGDLFYNSTSNSLKFYNGSSWQSIPTVTLGIANGNVLSANANVADNDFLKVDGTSVEGRDSTQVISDLSLDTVKKQGKETIWIPAAAMYPETTNGCAALAQVELANGPELKCLDFDASSDEHAQFSIAFPKSWNEGTVTFSAYFTVSGTNTGDVSWTLSGVSLSDNGDLNTAFGTAVAPAAKAHSGTSGDLDVTAESGAITIAGSPAVGDLCFFRVMRDVSADDQSADARLLGIKLHFTTDAANDA